MEIILIAIIIYVTFSFLSFKYFDMIWDWIFTEENPKKIKFYHPIIKKTYYDLLNYETKTDEIKQALLKQNAHMLEFYPYENINDRLNQIDKNHALQTIFNYIKFDKVKVCYSKMFNQS